MATLGNPPLVKRRRGRPTSQLEEAVQIVTFQGTKQERLQQLYGEWHGCQDCFLGQNKIACGGTQDIVFADGNPDSSILVVGEAPGEEEEQRSIPFVGASGRLLNMILATASLDPAIQELSEWYRKAPRTQETEKIFHERVFEWRQREFFITNAVACRPPENRTPTYNELKACWERLWNIIYIVDPLVIAVCGNSALSAVMRKVQVKITADRGKVFDVKFNGRIGEMVYPVIPTFHPSYLMRKADWKVKGGDFDKSVDDWKKIVEIAAFLKKAHGLEVQP